MTRNPTIAQPARSSWRPGLAWTGVLAGSVLALGLCLPAQAESETLLEMGTFEPDEIESVGFELPRRARIDIEAVGIRPVRDRGMTAYAWILDSKTRKPVWVLERRGTSRVKGSRLLRQANESLDLGPGRYELYTYAGPSSSWHMWRDGDTDIPGISHLLHLLGGSGSSSHRGSSDRTWGRALDDCHVRLSSENISKSELESFEPTGEIPGALLRYTKLGNGEFLQSGFTLEKPMDLRLYSVIEFPEDWDHPSDQAWIIDAATRERVWQIDDQNTQEAGGAEKNRLYDGEIRLEAGTYVLFVGTDDSHSYDEFNAAPPHDPFNWGITVLPGKRFEASRFRTTEAPKRGEPLIQMTAVRNSQYFEQPFRLEKETTLLVQAVGEYASRKDEFADFAWIEKAVGDDVVWEMGYNNTVHAGGAAKNRMFDGKVRLPAGDYVAYYVTDDSHSYRRWNADRPFEPEAWGLAVYPGPGFKSKSFKKLSESELRDDPNMLARLVRVGNNERRRHTFVLDKSTRVHIYALGEGDRQDMFDLAYIVDKKRGNTVWEMTWRNTRHAGGARKNRVFDGEVLLDAGTYEVHYETDDSHSFPGWNASRPRQPHKWGITIARAR